jgi:hypothetical protein
MKTRKNSTAKRANFIIVRTRLCGMDHKIHLKALAVDMAQNVHKPCLDTTPIHPADDM